MITSLFAIVAFFQAARAYDLSIIGSTCESITYRMTLIPGEWTLGFSWNTQLFLDSGSSVYLQERRYFGADGFSSTELSQSFTYTFPSLGDSYSNAYVRVEIDGSDGRAINYDSSNDPDVANIAAPLYCSSPNPSTITITTTPIPTPTPTTTTQSSTTTTIRSTSSSYMSSSSIYPSSSSIYPSSSSSIYPYPPTFSPVHKVDVGAIAGGTVGGVAALAAIAFVVFFLCLRKRRKHIYDTETYEGTATAQVWSGVTGLQTSSDIEQGKEGGSFNSDNQNDVEYEPRLPRSSSENRPTSELNHSSTRFAGRQNPLLSPDQFTKATFRSRESMP